MCGGGGKKEGGRGLLLEGTSGHASAALCGRDASGHSDGDAAVGALGAVAAQAVLVAVEEGRVDGVLGVAAPVPVLIEFKSG